jgi:hypothetical protein
MLVLVESMRNRRSIETRFQVYFYGFERTERIYLLPVRSRERERGKVTIFIEIAHSCLFPFNGRTTVGDNIMFNDGFAPIYFRSV